jgi:hypothetical protein
MSGCLYSFANDDCKGDYTGFKLDFESKQTILPIHMEELTISRLEADTGIPKKDSGQR